MQLTSTAFENNQEIPENYTCDGDMINPPLQISEVPETTKSLALIVEDPDAPVELWIHWIIWNIPTNTQEIPSGSNKIGTTGKNSSNNNSWDPICPPDKEHRYYFKLFALDTTLDLDPEKATRDDFYNAMEKHLIERTELMGRYNRKRNR